MNTSRKIKSEAATVRAIQKLKAQGKTVVAMCGSFDLLHAGHAESLEAARKKGDVLVVLINTDRSVRRYKGPTRPILPEAHRARMLAALAAVDYVVFFDEWTPRRLLARIRPHIYCKGLDWGKNCIERSVVEAHGGKVAVLNIQIDTSSTQVISAVLAAHKNTNIERAICIERGQDKAQMQLIKDFARVQGLHVSLLDPRPVNALNALVAFVKRKNINLSKSWFIGERPETILLGREVNAKTIKVGKQIHRSLSVGPHYKLSDIPHALRLIQRELK